LQLEDYLKAGSIAGEVRENVRKPESYQARLRSLCRQNYDSQF